MNDSSALEGIVTKSENIEIAYKELKRLSQDEEKRMEYEARQKAIRDYNHLMYQSKQEGIKEGFEKGEELGLKKGEELGLKKGEELGLKKGEELGLKKGEELGLKKGEELGLKKGEELGLKKGEELGLKKGKIETARKLLLKGFNIEEVIEFTDLTLEQIGKLKEDV